MTALQQYNGLQGVVSKSQLIELSEQAEKEGQIHISRILNSIIDDQNRYNITSVTPTIEREDLSNFNGLDEIIDYGPTEGLSKPISPNDIYDFVTGSIIDLLEEDIKWKKEWKQSEEGFYNAFNFESKKPYRGINQILLGSLRRFNPKHPLLDNPYYLTFKQVEKFNGTLKKGAKSKRAIYFTQLYKYEQVEPVKLNFATYKKEAFIAWLKKNKKNIPLLKGNKSFTIGELTAQSVFPILKYYNVFNGADINGIDFKLDNSDIPGHIKKLSTKYQDKIKIAEEIIKHYPKPVPDFKIGGDRAFYRPSTDLVQMPNIKNFEYVQAYYSTLFHEYIHSTGSKKRLNRKKGKAFGDKDYAFEELIAEFGATFLCAEAGILHFTQRNSAAYIKSWRRTLLAIVKKDNRFLFRASSKAQRATDFILKPNELGVAKYRRNQKKNTKSSPKKTNLNDAVLSNKGKQLKFHGLSVPYVELVSTKRKPSPETTSLLEPIKQVIVSPKMNIKDPVVHQPIITYKKPPLPQKRPKGLRTMADLDNRSVPIETYSLNTEIGKFLGKLEKKPKGSVVVTLDASAGSGKTRFFFQVMEDYASIGKRCLFLTLEEHSQSQLFKDKRDQYISSKNYEYISIVDADEIKTYKDLTSLVNAHDVILVDSFGKLKRLIKELKLGLDEHLRIAFDGKLFFLIFQRTTGKTMRGGSDSEFDGDVILQVEKPTENYQDNFVTARKNRYNALPNLKYNVYHQKMIKDGESITENPKPKPKRKLVVHSLDS